MDSQVLYEFGLKAGLSNALLICGLVLARVLPIVLLAPFLGGEPVPSQVKMGMGLIFTFLIYPCVADAPIPPGIVAFMLLMLKEIFVGATLAIISMTVFDAARAAGTIVDTISGANMATLFVPQLQQQASLFADLKFQLAVVLFLGLNGHHVVIESLFTSFQVIPLSTWPKFGHGFWPLFALVTRMAADVLVVATALAAPAGIACFLTDIALGLINRVAPQIQVFFMSQSIKPMMAAFIVVTSLYFVHERILDMFRLMLARLQMTIALFS